jgi:copper chaperone CopZ
MKAKSAGILAAVLGSICCVGPLLLVAFGLGAGAAVIGRYHWFFVIGAIAVLAWAWTKHFRERALCACEHRSMEGRGISLLTLLLVSAIVLTFAALNVRGYVFAGSPALAESASSADLQRVVIPVEGMTCAACSIAVRHALKGVNGVASADVSVVKKTATVDYEASKTNPKQLVAAINSTGYHATLPNKKPQSISENSPVASGGVANANTDRVSFFKVPLKCPAAPQIGCGSAAKPILLELEHESGVAEAWLNRAGTLIAVVWKSQPNAQTQQDLTSRLRSAGCCARDAGINAVQGEARDQALKEFQSGHGWYRGAEVDRLSEEEAGIIATRLVRRVEAKTMLPKIKADRLRKVLAGVLTKCFTEGDQGRLQVRQLARDFLDEKQMAILEQAIGKGVRPLPNES